MILNHQLSLPNELAQRKKPYNLQKKDSKLFKREFSRYLPKIFPLIKKKSFIPPCGKIFNKIFFDKQQLSTNIGFWGIIKTNLKSLLFLSKIRKIKKFKNIIYVTNSNSHNFFHWFLDVLQKIEFIDQSRKYILNHKFSIIIPVKHNNFYIKESIQAFNLNFYFQSKNELIVSDKSILIPNLAPTGNYRKKIVLNLRQRIRNYWIKRYLIKKNNTCDRVYISRQSTNKRRLQNEDKIISILKKFKFNILDFDQINFDKQIKYIMNSKILISIHGAGLTHMLWMRPKSKILEIRAKNNCEDNCYFSLASDLGHKYYYITANKTDNKKSFHESDLILNSKYFSKQLNKILDEF
jgi:capsular polysaccharide biosynthesis protein